MRRRPFRRWTAWIRCCRFLPDVPNATVSSTTATEHSPCMPPWTRPPDGFTAKPPLATPAASSSPSSRKSSPCAPGTSRFTSSWTISRLTKPLRSASSWNNNPRVHFHFTPTYSSWLNQVELWFAKIERDVIARGIFTSVSDLARKLRRYINAYSANARPFQWKYSDPTRRILSNEFTATGH